MNAQTLSLAIQMAKDVYGDTTRYTEFMPVAEEPPQEGQEAELIFSDNDDEPSNQPDGDDGPHSVNWNVDSIEANSEHYDIVMEKKDEM